MLGLRFSRLVHAAIASGALVLGACTDDPDGDTDTDGTTTDSTTDEPEPTTFDPGPPPPPPGDSVAPAIAAVTLVDSFTLQLTFTEPVAPVDTVNPKRFRLSMARGYSGYYGGEPSVYLRDPRFYNLTYYCPPPSPACYYYPAPDYCYYGPYCYYQPSGPIEVADLFNHYADPNSVVLSLTTPIMPSLCDVVDSSNGNPTFSFVLHLHYASGGQAQITDLAGLPLPSLADPWVKYGGNYYSYVNATPFLNFNPFLPIPCTI